MPGYAALTCANTKGDTILQDSRPRFSLFLHYKGNIPFENGKQACGWLRNAGHGTIRASADAVLQQLALDSQEVEQQVMTSTLA